MAATQLPLDLSISPSLTMQNMLHPACLGCPVLAAPSDLDPTQLSPPWDWIVKPGPVRQTRVFRPSQASAAAQLAAHPVYCLFPGTLTDS